MTDSDTVNTPVALYVYAMVVFSVFVVPPSPKVHNRFVIVPVDVSVNVTANGTRPAVGLPLKLGTGTIAPAPVTAFVAPPPILAKITWSGKLPALAGVKLTTTFVEPKPAILNGLPEAIANGATSTAAVPLRSAPPKLVTTKVAWTVVPVAIVPKEKLPGLTIKLAGVRPVPVTAFVETPPVLVKTTLLVTGPAADGEKLMSTRPVAPPTTV